MGYLALKSSLTLEKNHNSETRLKDDFDRDVYCLAGLPFDAVDTPRAIHILKESTRNRTRCFLSTPNLNFLIASQSDSGFRDSVIHSDLVVADGMPLIWMAKLLRIPIRERVAGSSIFEALRVQESSSPISVYFFGGPDGVAEIAAKKINQLKRGLYCVGYQSPGFVSVEAMSDATRIAQINISNADFLVVSLGAKKGQAWIMRNMDFINAPVISHLGAVVNFEASTLKRAPKWMQNSGLEWLWRIKEEPDLWQRYWKDGLAFMRLLTVNIIPHALWLTLTPPQRHQSPHNDSVHLECDASVCRLIITNNIFDPVSSEIRSKMRQANLNKKDIVIDLTSISYLSPGFLGLLLLLKKNTENNSMKLTVIGLQSKMKRLLKWNGLTRLTK
jgi:N-acetylglucosaminyldiphosphoundecaprenol N-acetyl-beta-D-mannosaminyltransferase